MTRRQLRRTTEEYFGRARTSRAETIESEQAPSRHRARPEAGSTLIWQRLAYPILEGRGELLPSRLKQD
jgi:hypothetical protein